MRWTVDEIEAEALRLPEEERARLLERLIQTFDESLDLDEDVAAAWVQEAERRDREMTLGNEVGVPAEDVFRRLRSSAE